MTKVKMELLLFLGWVGLAFAVGKWSQRRGYPFWIPFIMSLLLFPAIGFIAVEAYHSDVKTRQLQENNFKYPESPKSDKRKIDKP